MGDLRYLRGGEVTVKINGKAVGGVISAFCKTENNLIKIEEFLTDKPVCSVTNPVYIIELKTHIDPDTLFGGDPLESVAFESLNKTVEYTDCAVKQTTSSITAKGITEYGVVIGAGNRSVEND